MAELGMGNLYDYNKSRVNLLPALSKVKIREAQRELNIYMKNTNHTYYMLLCREKNDYTIFKTNQTTEGNTHNIKVALEEIIPSRNVTIKEIERNGINQSYEIWVSSDDDSYMYLFFPCDNFVIDEV